MGREVCDRRPVEKALDWSLFHHKQAVVPAKIYLHDAMYVYASWSLGFST